VRAALAFLTPFGGARAPGPGTFDWFPFVGAGIGLALGGVWWLVSEAWPRPVAAALVVAADLGLTGMLHFDGLVDSADGLLPPLDRGRRLSVMADPGVGAFGLAVGASVLLLRWAALTALRPGVLLVAGLWCLSRTAMVIVARSQPYVRGPAGLAAAFQPEFPAGESVEGRRRSLLLGAGAALAVGLLLGWRIGPGAASGGAAVAGAVAVTLLARRRIGGFTGDVLGACGVVAETAGLVVAAARW
jgi:adenosylcobinamide-GDP ribazoletransferase